jgi:acyl transferase domain-containing protein
MGAAAAVLLSPPPVVAAARGGNAAGDRPLVLAAHKSAAGHAEAAAGLVGLACAILALEAAAVLPILHLRCETV